MKTNKIWFIFIFLILFIASCRTERIIEVPVEVEKIKTEYKETIKYDSIYIRDSIDRYTKGDTIFIYKEKTKFQYKYKYDTIVVRDSIQYPKYITNEIEVNKLKTWQIVLMCIGSAAICYVIGKLII